MTCQYLKLNDDFIWINIDQQFSEEKFLSVLERHSELKILDKKTTYSAIGPLELEREISTNLGVINIKSVFEGYEEDCGTSISSTSKTLMANVFSALNKSDTIVEGQT